MDLLLKNCFLLDANSDYVSADIKISAGLITSVAVKNNEDGESKDYTVVNCKNPEYECEVTDMKGYTVMPSVIDSHLHVSSRNGHSAQLLRGLAENGISTVRDMGMLNSLPLEDYMGWLTKHQGPEYASVVTAGRYIDVADGYGMGPNNAGWGIEISSAEDAKAAVEYQKARGVDGIKTGISDGYTGPIRNRISKELFRALAGACKSNGLWFSAHIGRVDDLRFAVENGITDAAHTPGDKEMEDDLIAMMVEKHISMNTTVGNMAAPLRFLPKGYKDEAELRQNQQNMLNNLKRFYDAGGLIVTGTDRQDRDGSGGNTQIPVWEMQQLLNAGIPFKEVIKTATLNGALLCGRNDEGLIEEGMKANLIAFKGKMDNSFSQLLDLKFVMHEGTILKHETGFVHALENIS